MDSVEICTLHDIHFIPLGLRLYTSPCVCYSATSPYFLHPHINMRLLIFSNLLWGLTQSSTVRVLSSELESPLVG